MKVKNSLFCLLSILMLCSCNIDLNVVNINKASSSSKISSNIEIPSNYCEDYDACKVEDDSAINIENYDIYNTYTEAYNKVKDTSVAIYGYSVSTLEDGTETSKLIAYNSGFIIDKQSKNAATYTYTVLTSSVFLSSASVFEISLNDGNLYEASKVGEYSDTYYQLGIYQFESDISLTLANIVYDKEIEVGEELLTMSSPAISTTLMNTMTKGIVSGKNRQVEVYTKLYAMGFQFDAPTNVGSEGGAIFDCEGNIYGMIAGKITETTSVNVESVSIGNNLKDIKHIIDTIITGNTYEKPLLGVSVIDYTTMKFYADTYYLYPTSSGVLDVDNVTESQLETKISLPLDVNKGIYISMVSEGSVSYNGGMKAGDIILYIDDVEVIDNVSLAMYMYTLDKGDTVIIKTYLNPDGFTLTL